MTRTLTDSRTPAAILVAAGVFLSGTAFAGPLAGPSVDASANANSLVERNIDGSMRRSDVPVAEAALKLVTLDAGTQARVDGLLAERAKTIDGIVKANRETLNKFRTDRTANKGQAGEQSGRREQMRTMMEMFKPVLEKGPLERQLAALMPEATRASYLGHIEEHREVMAAERRERGPRGPEGRRGPGGPGRGGEPGAGRGPGDGDGPMLFEDPMLEMIDPMDDRPDRSRRPRGERGEGRGGQREMMGQMHSLQLEIRRSVERLSGEREARAEDFVAELGLTAVQEAKVRDLLQQARQVSRESDNPREARRAIMAELSSLLTPEQLTKLRESRGRQGQGARKGRGRPDTKD